MRKPKELVKYCAECGKQLERIRFASGRLEDYGAFCRRKYCNRECMRKKFLKQGNYSERNYRDCHVTSQKMNEVILKKTCCEKCGKTGKLDVHHIDENWKNNTVENLMVLCRSCHMKIHRQSKKLCPVCGKPAVSLGYCDKHYQRYRKYGNPLMINRGHGHIVLENLQKENAGV